jgi:hypothetical protein
MGGPEGGEHEEDAMSAGKGPKFPNRSQKNWDLINSDHGHRDPTLCDYNPIFIQCPKVPSFFIRRIRESIKYRNRGNNVFQKGLYGFFENLGRFPQNGSKTLKNPITRAILAHL